MESVPSLFGMCRGFVQVLHGVGCTWTSSAKLSRIIRGGGGGGPLVLALTFFTGAHTRVPLDLLWI